MEIEYTLHRQCLGQCIWRCQYMFPSTSIHILTISQLLGFAIAGLNGHRGYHGWRWYGALQFISSQTNSQSRIFIIEGSIAAVTAFSLKGIMPDWPETANFLTPDERVVIATRIRKEGITARMDRADRKALMRCLKDWKIWICALVYIGTTNAAYGIDLFVRT